MRIAGLKRTCLFESHQRLGARLVEFGGWEMPVQYTGIADEHRAVRAAAGLFDISHMGQFLVSGPGSMEGLDFVLTNNLAALAVGTGQYTLMCNPQGGVLDDLYVYRIGPDSFLLIVNASRVEADFAWLREHLGRRGHKAPLLRDLSGEMGAMALQGPAARMFIDRCFSPGSVFPGGVKPSEVRKNRIISFSWEGAGVHLACTGYTGEDGFELVAPVSVLPALWETVLREGGGHGLKPAGLGARDTLRTEMCFPLYGQELSEQTSPLEAGLSRFVDFSRPFLGDKALAGQRELGVPRALAAFQMPGKAPPPRPRYRVLDPGSGVPVGEVTSGTQSPSLGRGIGMGLVPPALARPGGRLLIEIRGTLFEAEVVSRPFYRRG